MDPANDVIFRMGNIYIDLYEMQPLIYNYKTK